MKSLKLFSPFSIETEELYSIKGGTRSWDTSYDVLDSNGNIKRTGTDSAGTDNASDTKGTTTFDDGTISKKDSVPKW